MLTATPWIGRGVIISWNSACGCFTIEINDNNTLCIIEYNFCYTNTIDLKMSTKTVNACVNLWCKLPKAGAINIVVASKRRTLPIKNCSISIQNLEYQCQLWYRTNVNRFFSHIHYFLSKLMQFSVKILEKGPLYKVLFGVN